MLYILIFSNKLGFILETSLSYTEFCYDELDDYADRHIFWVSRVECRYAECHSAIIYGVCAILGIFELNLRLLYYKTLLYYLVSFIYSLFTNTLYPFTFPH